jgi:hypothetical protein
LPSAVVTPVHAVLPLHSFPFGQGVAQYESLPNCEQTPDVALQSSSVTQSVQPAAFSPGSVGSPLAPGAAPFEAEHATAAPPNATKNPATNNSAWASRSERIAPAMSARATIDHRIRRRRAGASGRDGSF